MAIADITYLKGIYFFEGCLAEMVLGNSVATLRDLFLELIPEKIFASKNIDNPPLNKSFNRLLPQIVNYKKNIRVFAVDRFSRMTKDKHRTTLSSGGVCDYHTHKECRPKFQELAEGIY